MLQKKNKMEKGTKQIRLPKIPFRSSTISSQISTQRNSSQSSLQKHLLQIREQQKSVRQSQQIKKFKGIQRMSNFKKQYERISKFQIKKYDDRERISLGDEDIIEEEKMCAFLYQYDSMYKPAHRHKTALTYYADQLFLFGGFGCEKYLGLSKYSLSSQEWENGVAEGLDRHDKALYSHSMATFKGFAYIFGGVKMGSPTSSLFQMNLENSQKNQLSNAPFRRRDHACTFLNRFMVVQGGIEGLDELKNNLFYFDTQSLRWSVPQQYQMPYLSHHALVAVPQKPRKKQYSLYDVLGDNLYIFGGKNEKQSSTNKLFKIKARQSNDLTTEQIFANGTPYPRFSACVQFIDPSYICVYGGKSDVEQSNHQMDRGIFNDISLFHTDKKEWIIPMMNTKLPFRFGASCTSVKNKLYIFGGSEANSYSNGVLLEVLITKEGEEEDMQDIINRRGRIRG